jgi:hypothetical protein
MHKVARRPYPCGLAANAGLKASIFSLKLLKENKNIGFE